MYFLRRRGKLFIFCIYLVILFVTVNKIYLNTKYDWLDYYVAQRCYQPDFSFERRQATFRSFSAADRGYEAS